MTQADKSHEVIITHNSSHDGDDIYCITTESGAIDAVYHTADRRYAIANFDVVANARRRGIGKELLRASKQHACELGARIIFAAIISRECLDAMQTVFGEENVYVGELGDYAPEGADTGAKPTSAVLQMYIKPTK